VNKMTINFSKTLILLIMVFFIMSLAHGEQQATENESNEKKVTEESDANGDNTKEEHWYGTLERFNKHPISVKYKIKKQNTDVTNAELIINKETFRLDDFTRGELDNKVGRFVRFRFKPGGTEEVECLLTISDSETNAYSGFCPPNAAFDTTGVRRLTMQRSADEKETKEATPVDQ
jgi:hypothetical protein